MCGRFNVTSEPLADLLMDLVGDKLEVEDNFNVSPTQNTLIVREEQDIDLGGKPTLRAPLEAVSARWWLIPSWAKAPSTKYSMFNARCENLRKSAAFRQPFQSRRCVVPTSGYYEWVNRNGRKQPYYLSGRGGLLLAGLWDRWQDPDTDNVIESFTVVTTDIAPDLKFIHHRQPVMLTRDEALTWIDHTSERDSFAALFEPRIPVELSVVPVSTFVSNSRNNGPQCVEPVGERLVFAPT